MSPSLILERLQSIRHEIEHGKLAAARNEVIACLEDDIPPYINLQRDRSTNEPIHPSVAACEVEASLRAIVNLLESPDTAGLALREADIAIAAWKSMMSGDQPLHPSGSQVSTKTHPSIHSIRTRLQ